MSRKHFEAIALAISTDVKLAFKDLDATLRFLRACGVNRD